MKNDEHLFQKTVVQYLELLKKRGCLEYCSIPNGFQVSPQPPMTPRSFSWAKAETSRIKSKLKAEGMQSGAPDLMVFFDCGKVLHLELKTNSGTQSPDQKKWQKSIEAMGHVYCLLRPKEFDAFVSFYNNLFKEKK